MKVLREIAGAVPPRCRKYIKYRLSGVTGRLKVLTGTETKLPIKDWRDIPVIINNRNRLTSLRMLIGWLEDRGVRHIYILDNDSTYAPLLDFYACCRHTILYLGENLGKTALWRSEHYRKVFRHNYFIYTDPDVLPDEDCPHDAIGFLWEKLKRHEPYTEKVGLGIRIDDLPDHFYQKKQVLEWEKAFWENPIDESLYEAAIDTTFALYRPYAPHNEFAGYRTSEPYLLRHLPWYLDYDDLSEEEEYYLRHAVVSSTLGRTINENSAYNKRN